MKIYNRKHFNFKDFNIYCYGWETYNSWGHHATLFDASQELSSDKARYYNRTWECYTFQSVILSAIHKAIEQRKENIYYNYKYENNKKRLTKEQKQALTDGDKRINDLKEAYTYFSKEYHGY